MVCLECGGLFKALSTHVKTHDLTIAEYKEQWGYNRRTALVAPRTSELFRQHALAQGLPTLGPPGSIQKALEEYRRHSPIPRRLERRLAVGEEVRARVATGWRPRRRQKVDDHTLRALVQEGLTFRGIAARTGAAYNTVRQRIRALGVLSPAIAPRRLKTTDAELLALCRAGLWPREIASRVGLSEGGVHHRLRRLRRRGAAVPRPAGPRLNPMRRVTDDEIIPLVRAGLGCAAIASRVGLALSTVEQRVARLRRRGLLPPARSRPPVTEPNLQQVLALAGSGFGPSAIAARTGLAVSAVAWRLHRLRQGGQLAPPRRGAHVNEARLLALAKEKLSRREMAARTGLTLAAVKMRLQGLRRRGLLPPAPRPKAKPPVTPEELRALVQEGLALAQVARRTGLSYSRARKRIRRLGLVGPGVGPIRRTVPDAELLALRHAGLWDTEIAARVGMKVHAVSERLRKLRNRGVPVPRPARPVPSPQRRVSHEQLIALARENLSGRAVARRVGLHHVGVNTRLRNMRRRGLLPERVLAPAQGSRDEG